MQYTSGCVCFAMGPFWAFCQYCFRAPEARNGTLAVTGVEGSTYFRMCFPFPASDCPDLEMAFCHLGSSGSGGGRLRMRETQLGDLIDRSV